MAKHVPGLDKENIAPKSLKGAFDYINGNEQHYQPSTNRKNENVAHLNLLRRQKKEKEFLSLLMASPDKTEKPGKGDKPLRANDTPSFADRILGPDPLNSSLLFTPARPRRSSDLMNQQGNIRASLVLQSMESLKSEILSTLHNEEVQSLAEEDLPHFRVEMPEESEPFFVHSVQHEPSPNAKANRPRRERTVENMRMEQESMEALLASVKSLAIKAASLKLTPRPDTLTRTPLPEPNEFEKRLIQEGSIQDMHHSIFNTSHIDISFNNALDTSTASSTATIQENGSVTDMNGSFQERERKLARLRLRQGGREVSIALNSPTHESTDLSHAMPTHTASTGTHSPDMYPTAIAVETPRAVSISVEASPKQFSPEDPVQLNDPQPFGLSSRPSRSPYVSPNRSRTAPILLGTYSSARKSPYRSTPSSARLEMNQSEAASVESSVQLDSSFRSPLLLVDRVVPEPVVSPGELEASYELASAPTQVPDDSAILSLSLEERLTHKKWNVRLQAYMQLAEMFAQPLRDANEDAVFEKYGPWLKTIIVDANTQSQQQALKTVDTYLDNCPMAKSSSLFLIPTLIEKCLPSREPIHQLSQDVILKFAQIDDPNIVMDELSSRFSNKNLKIAVSALLTAVLVVRRFGTAVTFTNNLQLRVGSAMKHHSNQVRQHAMELLQESIKCELISDPVAMLDSLQLRPAQRIEIEKALQHVNWVSVQPGTESVQAKASPSSQADPQPPVELVSLLPPNWIDCPYLPAWSERKALLQEVSQALDRENLTFRQYQPVLNVVVRLFADTNFSVSLAALRFFAHFCQRFHRILGHLYSKSIVPTLIELYKERKIQVIQAVDEALLALARFKCIHLEQLIEQLIDLLRKHPHPEVRTRVMNILNVFTSKLLSSSESSNHTTVNDLIESPAWRKPSIVRLLGDTLVDMIKTDSSVKMRQLATQFLDQLSRNVDSSLYESYVQQTKRPTNRRRSLSTTNLRAVNRLDKADSTQTSVQAAPLDNDSEFDSSCKEKEQTPEPLSKNAFLRGSRTMTPSRIPRLKSLVRTEPRISTHRTTTPGPAQNEVMQATEPQPIQEPVQTSASIFEQILSTPSKRRKTPHFPVHKDDLVLYPIVSVLKDILAANEKDYREKSEELLHTVTHAENELKRNGRHGVLLECLKILFEELLKRPNAIGRIDNLTRGTVKTVASIFRSAEDLSMDASMNVYLILLICMRYHESKGTAETLLTFLVHLYDPQPVLESLASMLLTLHDSKIVLEFVDWMAHVIEKGVVKGIDISEQLLQHLKEAIQLLDHKSSAGRQTVNRFVKRLQRITDSALTHLVTDLVTVNNDEKSPAPKSVQRRKVVPSLPEADCSMLSADDGKLVLAGSSQVVSAVDAHDTSNVSCKTDLDQSYESTGSELPSSSSITNAFDTFLFSPTTKPDSPYAHALETVSERPVEQDSVVNFDHDTIEVVEQDLEKQKLIEELKLKYQKQVSMHVETLAVLQEANRSYLTQVAENNKLLANLEDQQRRAETLQQELNSITASSSLLETGLSVIHNVTTPEKNPTHIFISNTSLNTISAIDFNSHDDVEHVLTVETSHHEPSKIVSTLPDPSIHTTSAELLLSSNTVTVSTVFHPPQESVQRHQAELVQAPVYADGAIVLSNPVDSQLGSAPRSLQQTVTPIPLAPLLPGHHAISEKLSSTEPQNQEEALRMMQQLLLHETVSADKILSLLLHCLHRLPIEPVSSVHTRVAQGLNAILSDVETVSAFPKSMIVYLLHDLQQLILNYRASAKETGSAQELLYSLLSRAINSVLSLSHRKSLVAALIQQLETVLTDIRESANGSTILSAVYRVRLLHNYLEQVCSSLNQHGADSLPIFDILVEIYRFFESDSNLEVLKQTNLDPAVAEPLTAVITRLLQFVQLLTEPCPDKISSFLAAFGKSETNSLVCFLSSLQQRRSSSKHV